MHLFDACPAALQSVGVRGGRLACELCTLRFMRMMLLVIHHVKVLQILQMMRNGEPDVVLLDELLHDLVGLISMEPKHKVLFRVSVEVGAMTDVAYRSTWPIFCSSSLDMIARIVISCSGKYWKGRG